MCGKKSSKKSDSDNGPADNVKPDDPTCVEVRKVECDGDAYVLFKVGARSDEDRFLKEDGEFTSRCRDNGVILFQPPQTPEYIARMRLKELKLDHRFFVLRRSTR